MNDEQKVARQQAHIEELEVTLARTVAERDDARQRLGQAQARIQELQHELKETVRQLGYTKGNLNLIEQAEAEQAKILSRLCSCNTGPDADGPAEDCPIHGRQEWSPASMWQALHSVPDLLDALDDVMGDYDHVSPEHLERARAWANNFQIDVERYLRAKENKGD